MHIGILQCDHIMDQLSHHGDYPQMFERLLGDRDSGLSFRIFDLTAHEFPRDLDQCDGYIVTGSRYGVYDDQSWIQPAHDLIRQLEHSNRNTVGICFGHQLIASALGGEVAKTSDKGWGVGVHSWQVMNKRAWMQPDMDRFSLLVSHQDQVLALPPRGQVLAGNTFCPIASYQIGDQFLGIQGHPEFNTSLVDGILEARTERIGPERVAAARATLDCPVQNEDIASWMLRFLRQDVQDSTAGPGHDADDQLTA